MEGSNRVTAKAFAGVAAKIGTNQAADVPLEIQAVFHIPAPIFLIYKGLIFIARFLPAKRATL